MAKLSWGTPGARFYEAGVDRGVLFVDGAGVAWSGLTSVSEKSPGGDLQEFFLDGVKYAQLMAAENYEATINAISSPREFAVCDGSVEIYAGFSATQQRRKTFDLSYRTRIGNDTSGTDLGYKIHVVYSALAGPSERTHDTIGDQADPMSLSWDITTLPASLTGIRPTAHFVIDTTRADPADVTTLENLLYGTVSVNSSIPTPTALAAIFA